MRGNKKIRVGILFGGKSAEHEVSLRSAKNVYEALDKEKYKPVLIGIDKKGKWLLEDGSRFLLERGNAGQEERGESVALVPQSEGRVTNFERPGSSETIDVVFPVLHGTFGEDGTVQGLLKLANIPFVGAGVLGSAVGMDKDVAKRLLRDAGIPIARFKTFREGDTVEFQEIVRALGVPLFVKPANLGSSVGVHKAHDEKEFRAAVKDAFRYDRKILVEEFIKGREIECSVLGNEDPIASLAGEVIPTHEFYSYEAKYLDENGAALEIPAKLPSEIMKRVQNTAVRAFRALECEGMARVDFFLKENGDLFVNEINTIPGFTSISMYPKLWEATGISYSELVDRLILLAIERFGRESRLETSYGQ
ncbi:MAG: D-alanine--D-alanine ligase A [Candidatus Sungbacteria bacterium RIFCSPHIGHO2_01_FULL_50_25]|uniref:D-alanine--D-alanine ligase n=1 Tax=Candidatus Sungbacteria bacterium RIFCSPHIGHO2_01_FULL_50_25 TaxID=1802265 RepID=A0A1G2KDT8_9BACT|nr:MAG: D-alanine--D-alanine ligase A [Candidatus Sungbacteria bacterium RIFCSPHIGHO2_01_FULL_50_25]